MTTPILSASQLTNFGTLKEGGSNDGCERRWHYKYVQKIPDISGPSAEAGKKIHSLLEHWLRDSIFPEGTSKEDNTARAMLKHAPEPSPDLRVEEAFHMEVDGVKFRGFKDLVWYDGATLVITDFKTTSDLRWAKTEQELRGDAQAILYAYSGFQESDTVDLSWLYGTRDRTPQVLQVRFNIDFSDVSAAIKPLTRTGKRILSMYGRMELPEPNLNQCAAFGGCPYRDICPVTPTDRVKALQHQHKRSEDKKMGFRDRLKNNNNGTGAATPVEVTAVEQTVEVAPTAVAKPTMREKLQGFGSAINPPVSAPVDTPVPTPMSEPVKRRPGRPRKTILEGVAKAQVMRETESPESCGGVRVGREYVEPAATGFTLYVNCMPQGPSTSLAKYLEPILAAINLEHGVEHYAQIDFKAAGILGAALWGALQSNPPTGDFVMDGDTGEGAHCLPTLLRFATKVVRRF